jgi:hypothetical protein
MPLPDRKLCLACDYILDGLPELRCPECGRPFDPEDARTFAVMPRPRWRSYSLYVAGLLYPWFLLAAFLATWLVAAAELGRFPQPIRDDPWNCGPVSRVAVGTTLVLCWAAPLSMAILGLGLSGPVGKAGRKGVRFLVMTFLCFLAGWAVAGAFFRYSAVGAWFME